MRGLSETSCGPPMSTARLRKGSAARVWMQRLTRVRVQVEGKQGKGQLCPAMAWGR